MMNAKYNGWSNRETWNVALWIGNDQGLYALAKQCKSYEQFVEQLKQCSEGSAMAFEFMDFIQHNEDSVVPARIAGRCLTLKD